MKKCLNESCTTMVPEKKQQKWCKSCYNIQANQRAKERYYKIKRGELIPKHRPLKLHTPAGMRQYQAAYYRTHQEKARAYQKEYAQRHRDKLHSSEKKRTTLTPIQINLIKNQTVFTASALMRISDAKFEKMCAKILTGQARVVT